MTHFALQVDDASMQKGDGLHDRSPEASAARVGSARRVYTVKAIEHAGKVLRRDATPGIGYFDLKDVIRRANFEFVMCARRSCEGVEAVG
jgi:hypothetical protein